MSLTSDKFEDIPGGAFERPEASDANGNGALLSIAISLKRIADRLDGMNLDGFGNQLLDIAYQAGVNFRGR